MDKSMLVRAGMEYERLYGGAKYYELAKEIVESYPVQASIIFAGSMEYRKISISHVKQRQKLDGSYHGNQRLRITL